MKRILLYFIILIAVLVLPTEGTDVADLQPVQTIAVYRDGNQWVIETDTEDVGRGNSVEKAFENLIQTAPAVIYLDTADYLILQQDAIAVIDRLRTRLKESVELCQYVGKPDLQQVSKYLSIHAQTIELKHWNSNAILPILDCTTERYFFM